MKRRPPPRLVAVPPAQRHASSTAPTRRQRRQENWGKAHGETSGTFRSRANNTVHSTINRHVYFNNEHAAPKSGRNHNGGPWLGFSRRNTRRPWRARPSWRTWYRPLTKAGKPR